MVDGTCFLNIASENGWFLAKSVVWERSFPVRRHYPYTRRLTSPLRQLEDLQSPEVYILVLPCSRTTSVPQRGSVFAAPSLPRASISSLRTFFLGSSRKSYFGFAVIAPVKFDEALSL